MNLYDYRKQIQKIYNDSVYGNTKGDIYSELSELRIDNEFIKSIECDSLKKSVTFELEENTSSKESDSLMSQISETIKQFAIKNLNNISEDMQSFLQSNMHYDSYYLNTNNGAKTVIIQL